ncbi:hypothetical protein JOC74_000239 [Bacillus capparidis]|uniref:Uncharacterized protein n=1 Tax=Bacillus capparidis TaxID=1840411 RepID=A0ABS4CRH3_9BACI|nr:hypothetical protein [Bacillus capparidis]
MQIPFAKRERNAQAATFRGKKPAEPPSESRHKNPGA